MLSWTERSDGWHASGFRIELSAPSRWLLLDDEREAAPVTLEESPLAVARTLTEAKREAELLDAARHRKELRKKHLVILGLIFALGVLLIGNSQPQNVAVVLVAVTLAFRSLGVIVGTILWKVAGGPDQVFFQ